ncbi:hypothetical protein LPJ70_004048 [Coemansia sp. RSA 2708]|nr:hypothetical protein LPJ70_004048 [Coemansia sp. RSA 2708]
MGIAADAKPVRPARAAKPHVPSACTNCKKAHLACDLQRPCQRCVNAGKCDTCKDVQHKKRGRPRTKDKKALASESPMETQMFQFSFAAPSTTPSTAPASPDTRCAAAAQPRSPNTIAPPPPECDLPGRASAMPISGNARTSYLFLTPALLCLRLEEMCPAGASALLGHSLLSLINRSALDFVSGCDQARTMAVFESIKQRISERLAQPPSQTYSHAVLGSAPPAVDPNTFQAVPVDRLLQRVCADICGDARVHLRTAAGCYDLFDMHVYVGAVPRSSAAATELALDEVYLVCRITKFSALSYTLSPSLAPQIAMPRTFGDYSSIRASPLDSASDRAAKRPRLSAEPAHDPLFMLAAVTDREADGQSASPSSKQSTVASSPLLASPSPSLTATSSPRSGGLPPLSDLLKTLNASNTHYTSSALLQR